MKSLKIALFLGLVTLFIFSGTYSVPGQQPQSGGQTTSSAVDSSLDIPKIIRAFTAKETEFRRALSEYAFKRDALVQTIGMGGEITGEYRRVSQFVFTDQNERFEKITYFPHPTLSHFTKKPGRPGAFNRSL